MEVQLRKCRQVGMELWEVERELRNGDLATGHQMLQELLQRWPLN